MDATGKCWDSAGKFAPTSGLTLSAPKRTRLRVRQLIHDLVFARSEAVGILHTVKVNVRNDGSVEAQYKAFVESNEREIAQLDERVKALESERQTLAELTAKTEKEIVDLVGAWQRGTLNQKLDLQRGLFGSHLAFDKKQGFLNTQNFLLMDEIQKVLVEANEDTSDSNQTRSEADEEPSEEIGVSDGV